MDVSLRDELQTLVHDIIASRVAISDTTRLYHDLRIAGDDAAELLDNVHRKFGTRFEGLKFEDYFPGETEVLIWHIARWLGISGRMKNLTFGHLVELVKAGYWFEPGSASF